MNYNQLNRLYQLSQIVHLTSKERLEYERLLKLHADSPGESEDQPNLTEFQKDILKWTKKRITPAVTHRRFLVEDDYVQGFKDRGEPVPPFLVFQPFEIRDGVRGYLVPCRPDHPDAEEA